MSGIQYIELISGVKKFNILTVSQNRDSIMLFRLITILIGSMQLLI